MGKRVSSIYDTRLESALRVRGMVQALRKHEVEALEAHAERFREWCEGLLGGA
jgi:hypothetical protein